MLLCRLALGRCARNGARSMIRSRPGLGWAAALAAAIGMAVPAIGQAPADPRVFAERALVQFQQALPQATFALEPSDPLQINVSGHPEWDEAALNLHRVFGYCQTIDAQTCDAELARLVIALTAQVNAASQSDLRIIVRDAAYWSYAVALADKNGEVPVHRQIGDDLFAILAIDSPETIRVATSGDLQEFGVDEAEAWQRAAEQTGLVIPPLPLNQDFSQGLIGFENDEYTGTMLIYLPQWAQIAERAGPDLAVTITSDQLVVAGLLPDGQELEEFRTLVEQDCAAAPRCISPHVYRFRDGNWVIAN